MGRILLAWLNRIYHFMLSNNDIFRPWNWLIRPAKKVYQLLRSFRRWAFRIYFQKKKLISNGTRDSSKWAATDRKTSKVNPKNIRQPKKAAHGASNGHSTFFFKFQKKIIFFPIFLRFRWFSTTFKKKNRKTNFSQEKSLSHFFEPKFQKSAKFAK